MEKNRVSTEIPNKVAILFFLFSFFAPSNIKLQFNITNVIIKIEFSTKNAIFELEKGSTKVVCEVKAYAINASKINAKIANVTISSTPV